MRYLFFGLVWFPQHAEKEKKRNEEKGAYETVKQLFKVLTSRPARLTSSSGVDLGFFLRGEESYSSSLFLRFYL